MNSSQQIGYKEKFDGLEKPLFLTPLRRYTGAIIQHPNRLILIEPAFDRFCISRNYCDNVNARIKVSWRFNEEGRLDSIDCLTAWKSDRNNRTKERKTLITVDNFHNRQDKSWEISQARYNYLPEEIDVVNPRFKLHSLARKYQLLVIYGHGAVKELMNCTGNKSLIKYHTFREGDIPLDGIVDDVEALYMINNAAKLQPAVNFNESSKDSGYLGEMIICYTRNYATFE